MSKPFVVNEEINIHASLAKVWDVLIKPAYVKEWDELPEGYPEEDMRVGSEVLWELPNGEHSKTTVIAAEKEKELKIALYVSNWSVFPERGEVAYTYKLEKAAEGTKLSIAIGDFSLLPDGENYYEASLEFANEAKQKN